MRYRIALLGCGHEVEGEPAECGSLVEGGRALAQACDLFTQDRRQLIGQAEASALVQAQDFTVAEEANEAPVAWISP